MLGLRVGTMGKVRGKFVAVDALPKYPWGRFTVTIIGSIDFREKAHCRLWQVRSLSPEERERAWELIDATNQLILKNEAARP